MKILNIPAVFFAFSFCIDKSFFLPNLNQLSNCSIASSHRQRKWVLCAPRHCKKWCNDIKEAKRRVSSLVSLFNILPWTTCWWWLCWSFMHEAMHVIGFSHEFNRFDRDKFVKPLFGNIRKGRCSSLMYCFWARCFFLIRKQLLAKIGQNRSKSRTLK